MTSKHFYELLKLKPSCSSDDITAAWLKIKQSAAVNSSQYQLAKQAYETLIDPVKREIYNTFHLGGDSLNDCVDNEFYFSSSFLQNSDIQQVVGKLKDPAGQQQAVSVSLQDIYAGKSIVVTSRAKIPCPHCKYAVSVLPCHNCRKALPSNVTLCSTCGNTGRVVVTGNCGACRGKKVLSGETKTEVVVKPGMLHGQKLRCTNGTEVILREKPHKVFSRQGNDLYMNKVVNITQSLCGFRFVIEHLDGRKLLVTSTIGNVLFPGCKKIIPKEGMPVLNSSNGKKGDLIIVFHVKVPNQLPTETVKDIERFLPKRPEFCMPSNPETEEFTLTEFDPNFRLVTAARYDEAYFEENRNINNPLLKPQKRCVHQ